jgi:hypothetical protein
LVIDYCLVIVSWSLVIFFNSEGQFNFSVLSNVLLFGKMRVWK